MPRPPMMMKNDEGNDVEVMDLTLSDDGTPPIPLPPYEPLADTPSDQTRPQHIKTEVAPDMFPQQQRLPPPDFPMPPPPYNNTFTMPGPVPTTPQRTAPPLSSVLGHPPLTPQSSENTHKRRKTSPTARTPSSSTPGFFGQHARGQLLHPNQPIQPPPSPEQLAEGFKALQSVLDQLNDVIPMTVAAMQRVQTLAAENKKLKKQVDRLSKETHLALKEMHGKVQEQIDASDDAFLASAIGQPVSGGAYGGDRMGTIPRTTGFFADMRSGNNNV